MSLHSDAAAGVLTLEALKRYHTTCNIDAPSTRDDETLGHTPLALAAWEGHVEVVRLLLQQGAKADAPSSENRTPLWIVTARGRGKGRAEIVDLLLKHNADPQYSDPALGNGSKPLENELKQLRDPEVIRLLVNANGTTTTARILAAKLNNPKILEAMVTREDRNKIHTIIVNNIIGLVFFVFRWVNTLTNAILTLFGIKDPKNDDNKTSEIEKEIGQPVTKEDFKASVNDFVHKHRLGAFFPRHDNKFLETLTSKAVELQKNGSAMGRAAKTEDLVKLGLYQPIIYCDDSGSMSTVDGGQSGTRMKAQAELVERIASICTRLVPDELGAHLRFINAKLPNADNLRMEGVRNFMSTINPTGWTEIGTNLRKQILEGYVYSGRMTRPLFVSIITDGIPRGPLGSPEKDGTLKQEIIECHRYLKRKGLPERAVIFQLSQIGSDPDSKKFLSGLKDDPELQGILYVTAQQLDSKFADFRQNENDLEAFLVETLLGPILDSSSD